MAEQKQKTFAEYLVGKVGLLKATKVCAFVVAWGIYMEKTDPLPTPYGRMEYTLEGYSAYWGQSAATTYRERDLFRICFPEDKTPDRVWLQIRSSYDARLDRKRRDAGAAQVLSVRGVWA